MGYDIRIKQGRAMIIKRGSTTIKSCAPLENSRRSSSVVPAEVRATRHWVDSERLSSLSCPTRARSRAFDDTLCVHLLILVL